MSYMASHVDFRADTDLVHVAALAIGCDLP